MKVLFFSFNSGFDQDTYLACLSRPCLVTISLNNDTVDSKIRFVHVAFAYILKFLFANISDAIHFLCLSSFFCGYIIHIGRSVRSCSQTIPEALAKIWLAAGSKVKAFSYMVRKLRSIAFQRCI